MRLRACLAATVVVVAANGCAPECLEDFDCGIGNSCVAARCETGGFVRDDGGGGGGGGAPPINVGGSGCQGGVGSFDPLDVHLLGTIAEGSGAGICIGPVDDPREFGTGLSDASPFNNAGRIRDDGSFVYASFSTDEIRVFDPDPLTREDDLCRFPDTEANDRVLVTCPERSFVSFHVRPNGELLYRCTGGEPYLTEAGTVIGFETEEFFHVGDQLGMTQGELFLLADPLAAPVPFVLPGTLIAARANGSGFRVAVQNGAVAEQYTITDGGVVTLVGEYPLPPERFQALFNSRLAAMSATGDLYVMTSDNDIVFNDGIFRLSLNGVAQQVLDEETVKAGLDEDTFANIMHGSQLVTGP
jgi:hypothetical protein